MPRFLEGITFIDGSGDEIVINGPVPLQRTTSSIDGAATHNTLPLRDNTNRFQVGDTDVSSTDGYIVINKNYVDGRISTTNQTIEAETTARQNKDSSLEAKINSLNYSDTAAADRKYVSKVTQTNGKIAVTHVNFSDAKATNSSYGFIKTGYTNDAANKNYAVKLDNNGDAYVNVPGSAYSNGEGLNLSNTSFSLNRTSTTNNTNYSIYFGTTNTGAVFYNNSKLTFNPSSGLLKATKMQCDTEPESSTDVVRKAELDTVNTRLNNLGFKSGRLIDFYGNTIANVSKNGNYVLISIIRFGESVSFVGDDGATISDFRPKSKKTGSITLPVLCYDGDELLGNANASISYEMTIYGTLTVSSSITSDDGNFWSIDSSRKIGVTFGYDKNE